MIVSIYIALLAFCLDTVQSVILYIFCVFCLFEWMPSQRKESGYPMIKDFASCPGLSSMVAHLTAQSCKKNKIPISVAGSILTQSKSCNLIPLMYGTKQARIWSEPGTSGVEKTALTGELEFSSRSN